MDNIGDSLTQMGHYLAELNSLIDDATATKSQLKVLTKYMQISNRIGHLTQAFNNHVDMLTVKFNIVSEDGIPEKKIGFSPDGE